MSLKVFHGYKSDNTNIAELLKRKKQLAETVHTEVNTTLSQLIILTAFNNYDLLTLKSYDFDVDIECKIPLFDAWNKFNEKLDLFGCSFYFCEFENNLYYLYTGSSFNIKYFENIMNVEIYKYFNNYDKPEEYTMVEWEERSRIWHTIIGDSAERNMFKAICDPLYVEFPKASNFISPSFNERVFAVIKKIKNKNNPEILRREIELSLKKDVNFGTLIDQWKGAI